MVEIYKYNCIIRGKIRILVTCTQVGTYTVNN